MDDARVQVEAAVGLARSGEISRTEALLRVDAASLADLLHPRLEAGAEDDHELLVGGSAASPGAVAGRVVLSADEARTSEGPIILVVETVSPDDKEGLLAASAVVAGGIGSHDLVVLRGLGVPVVSGCEDLEVDVEGGEARFGERTVALGEVVTVDGTGGSVLFGKAPVTAALLADEGDPGNDLRELLGWADDVRGLSVRANADMPEDAKKARAFGAEGIGLCRTERMFLKDGRLEAVRRLILSGGGGDGDALSEIEPGQRSDFEELFRAMDGLPVAVRLLDPPLHEFLPDPRELRERLIELDDGGEESQEVRRELENVERYVETNPMLGTRGVRLGILRPEIYKMQARAIAAALREVRKEGHEPAVEILVPLVQFPDELRRIKEMLKDEIGDQDISIGATVEAPRACAAAGDLAREASFLSFGTNDLTQTTLGISRDDAKGGFLPEYLKTGIIGADPFERIDEEGVGRLIRLARDLARETNPGLTLGVCGEHGGEPESIRFFHEANLDYVSCSPYRVPVARLAAAQAAVRRERSANG